MRAPRSPAPFFVARFTSWIRKDRIDLDTCCPAWRDMQRFKSKLILG